ncbi:hypothetical protein [Marinobacterium maritimum]
MSVLLVRRDNPTITHEYAVALSGTFPCGERFASQAQQPEGKGRG